MNGRSHAILGAAASVLALGIQEIDIIDQPLVYVPALFMGHHGWPVPRYRFGRKSVPKIVKVKQRSNPQRRAECDAHEAGDYGCGGQPLYRSPHSKRD